MVQSQLVRCLGILVYLICLNLPCNAIIWHYNVHSFLGILYAELL